MRTSLFVALVFSVFFRPSDGGGGQECAPCRAGGLKIRMAERDGADRP
ncbi:hypothetical protein KZY62_11085 [Prevotella denticola]|nr:hypothetical protein [Prevotella denticola]MBW4899107.1 hypothetical protein [Prevotella denticola]